MRKLKPCFSVLIIFLFFLSLSRPLHAQKPQFPIKEWAEKLIHDKIYYPNTTYAIVNTLSAYKSSVFEKVMTQLENEGRGEGTLFKLRLIHLRAGYIQQTDRVGGYEKIKLLLDSSMKIAYETEDNGLIAFASRAFGRIMYYYNDIVLAVTYSLKAAEILGGENLPKGVALDYTYLGEMLFHTMEYRQSIYYTQTGLRNLDTTDKELYGHRCHCINTIGQCYQQLGMVDSALYYFKFSYNMVHPQKNILWKGINSLYMGQINFTKGNFALAKQQLSFAYETNKNDEHSIAASALEWLAKLMMLQKKIDSARIYLSQSIGLLKQDEGKPLSLQVANYLRNVYFTKAEFHRIMNQPDSMNYYFSKYAFLQDSLQTVTINSNSKIAQQRIDNEKDQFAIQALQKEKRIVKITRNFIIAGISLLAIVIILILNRQKRELKYSEEMAQFQKRALESEKELNLRQLELFTHNLLEKSILVENLQQQLIEKSITQEQQQMINELSNQTILTEEDWTRFKTLFEKIYPGFFQKLKERTSDITVAEQRMAALTRLQLTGKEMATMLGISSDSVRKTRQRLRMRLQLDTEMNLDEYLNRL